MTNWTHRTIIVHAAFAPMARALATAAGPAGSGGGMFEAMLSPTAGKPPTHYISAGLIWPEFAHLLPAHDSEMWDADQAKLPESDRAPITERPVDSAGHPEEVVALAVQAQMPVTLEQVQAMFAACRVYTCGWQQAVAHLGLLPVRDDAPFALSGGKWVYVKCMVSQFNSRAVQAPPTKKATCLPPTGVTTACWVLWFDDYTESANSVWKPAHVTETEPTWLNPMKSTARWFE